MNCRLTKFCLCILLCVFTPHQAQAGYKQDANSCASGLSSSNASKGEILRRVVIDQQPYFTDLQFKELRNQDLVARFYNTLSNLPFFSIEQLLDIRDEHWLPENHQPRLQQLITVRAFLDSIVRPHASRAQLNYYYKILEIFLALEETANFVSHPLLDNSIGELVLRKKVSVQNTHVIFRIFAQTSLVGFAIGGLNAALIDAQVRLFHFDLTPANYYESALFILQEVNRIEDAIKEYVRSPLTRAIGKREYEFHRFVLQNFITMAEMYGLSNEQKQTLQSWVLKSPFF